ncbi:DUF1304 domain-containing protein [Demequina sediminicola]|uniref:DUF1304 domain-containing protein n=1 Tax=Demequina sediminicola TaxID=1095026 RepID=UPI000785008E|nr:DUF1304 domain-containing protein [Demequina sediminicola]
MLGVALVLAGAAALLHVYIFWMESFAWMRPATRRVFGIASEADARATRDMAYNQGFYNLFLAVITGVGIGFAASGSEAVGAALIFAGAGSMVAAAIVLITSGPAYRSAAIKQATLPLLAVVFLAFALI